MPVSGCPRCQARVTYARGTAPTCPSCGYPGADTRLEPWPEPFATEPVADGFAPAFLPAATDAPSPPHEAGWTQPAFEPVADVPAGGWHPAPEPPQPRKTSSGAVAAVLVVAIVVVAAAVAYVLVSDMPAFDFEAFGDDGTPGSSTVLFEQPALVGNTMPGRLSDGTVTVYALGADGSRGAQLATTATLPDGTYSIVTLATRPPAILIEASGGSWTNDGGARVDWDDLGHLQAIAPGASRVVALNGLTSMAAARGVALAEDGMPVDDAVDLANAEAGRAFGIPDIVGTLPAQASEEASVQAASWDQRAYGLALGGLQRLAQDLGVGDDELIPVLAQDFRDGTIDGRDGARSLTSIPRPHGGAPRPYPPSLGFNELPGAAMSFWMGPHKVPGPLPPTPSPPSSASPAAGTLRILTSALPPWQARQPGAVAIQASGAVGNITCSLAPGSIPPAWLVLNGCTLTGTPPALAPGTTRSISAPFSVLVQDQAQPVQATQATLWATVMAAPPAVTIHPAVCYVDEPCNALVATADGSLGPYRFVADNHGTGAPPAFILVGTDGHLQGTSHRVGTFGFGVCAVDIGGTMGCRATTVQVIERERPPMTDPGGGGGCTGDHDGKYAGTFTYSREYHTVDREGIEHPGTQSVQSTLRLRLTCTSHAEGLDYLAATEVSASHAFFGCVNGCDPDNAHAILPGTRPVPGGQSAAGTGFWIQFPNGAHLLTSNHPGHLVIESSGRMGNAGGIHHELLGQPTTWITTDLGNPGRFIVPAIPGSITDSETSSWSMMPVS